MNSQMNALAKVGKRVLEEWAMMMVDPSKRSTDIFHSDSELFSAKIRFKGVIDGSVTIVAQRAFLVLLTENVLGGESADSLNSSELNDAFRELTNVVTGNFLTEAYGDDTVFDVVLPEINAVNKASLDQVFRGMVVECFEADSLPIAMSFTLES